MPIGEQFRRFYPGLIPIESQLWRIWLKSHESEFDSFTYNFHVGQGITIPSRILTGEDPLDTKLRERYRQLTQKKIDVVGMRGNETWIFEVEERLSMRALGQILVYRSLLPKYKPVTGPIQVAVIAKRIGNDMLQVLEEQDALVYQVIP